MSKYRIDLNSLLGAMDTKNRKFYDTLSVEERKTFAGIVMLRFMSSSRGGDATFNLLMTNEIANPHFHDIYEHPELQYLLLTAASTGKRTNHQWLAGTKKDTDAHLMSFISRFWPQANKLDRAVILSEFDETSFAEFVDGSGVDDEEAKKLKKLYKNRRVSM